MVLIAGVVYLYRPWEHFDSARDEARRSSLSHRRRGSALSIQAQSEASEMTEREREIHRRILEAERLEKKISI